MSLSDFFNRDDEPSTSRVRPRLRPANFGSDPQEQTGTSGKGGGEPAEPTYDVNAPDWSDQVAKFNKKGGINNDGRFGYGYVDTQTGIEVPWYIDMINGGGANAAGDTFVSPFEGAPMGGGLFGIGSQAISGGLNAMGVAPYGSNRPRYFMPMEAARVDAEGKPVKVDQGPASPAPSGSGVNGGSPTVTPTGTPTLLLDTKQTIPRSVSQTAASEDAYMGGAPTTPQVAGPIMAGHNLPPIQGANPAVPTDTVNILEMGGTNLLNTQVLGTGRTVNTYGEQALREKAIQLYGQAFNDLTPSSQRLIIQGLMQGMVNASK